MRTQSLLNLISFIVVSLLSFAVVALLLVVAKALGAALSLIFVIWVLWKVNTYKSVNKEE